MKEATRADLPEATRPWHIQVRIGGKLRWRQSFRLDGREGVYIRPLFHRPDGERIACRFGNYRVVLVRFDEETMR